ncbi:hypothetical protein [Insolitispirillum peregrinum]|uniref:Uncharacterized protein n=1 Tax=Insolitispirillum peregrinum TaxID=80876 RepID=A0A1N7LLY3_9PROT|nr:hypothetical protein [Insolitispirillum peregrinum]SIS74840.1 hypothetical protein SAMN05421779_103414 [Insolitispirillum peregrinum]
MTKYSRLLSAALLSASLAVVGASAAQAASAGDHQPDDGQMGSPLVAHRVISTTNIANGVAVTYSKETLPVAAIGPRDANEQALNAADYGLKATRTVAPQLAANPN